MLRLLTATGTLLSLFAFITIGSKSKSPNRPYKVVGWAAAVRAHTQFSNWT
jgi:hypothetical protein